MSLISDASSALPGYQAPGVAASTGADIPLPDMLEYMADMIQELKEMSERTPCPTLTGLLRVAHAEALIRRQEAAAACHAGR